MRHITSEWLKSAKSDLDTIEEIIDNDALTHIAAFHAQQCVEKAFKAVIEEFEISTIKTHDLITLKNKVSSVYNESESLDEDFLSLLNKLYIDSRYPGDLGLLPYGKPKKEDTRRFYDRSREIYNKMKDFLENR
ncbi:HEPN domain-containing protein [Nitrospira defluvii]|nr:HEPN domain-containing protein [Nitrospira defluvii]